jgi:hypothetical protein
MKAIVFLVIALLGKKPAKKYIIGFYIDRSVSSSTCCYKHHLLHWDGYDWD